MRDLDLGRGTNGDIHDLDSGVIQELIQRFRRSCPWVSTRNSDGSFLIDVIDPAHLEPVPEIRGQVRVLDDRPRPDDGDSTG